MVQAVHVGKLSNMTESKLRTGLKSLQANDRLTDIGNVYLQLLYHTR